MANTEVPKSSDAKSLLAQYQPKVEKPLDVKEQLCSIRLSADGTLLAAGSFVGTVLRWDAQSTPFRPLPALTGHHGWVQRIAFSPTGETLYSADSWGRLTAWAEVSGEPKRAWDCADAHDGWIHSLAVSPDGTLIATGGRDGRIRLTRAADGTAARILTVGENVLALAFHPDGKQIVSGDLKGRVQFWNVADGSRIRSLDAGVMFRRDRLQDVGGVRSLLFSPDGGTLLVGGCEPKSGAFVQGFPLILATVGDTLKLLYRGGSDNEGFVYELLWHPGGFLIAITSGQPGQGRLLFLKPNQDKPFFVYPLPNPHSMTLRSDGRLLVVAATNPNSSGNGRTLTKENEYPANVSPLHLFTISG